MGCSQSSKLETAVFLPGKSVKVNKECNERVRLILTLLDVSGECCRSARPQTGLRGSIRSGVHSGWRHHLPKQSRENP